LKNGTHDDCGKARVESTAKRKKSRVSGQEGGVVRHRKKLQKKGGGLKNTVGHATSIFTVVEKNWVVTLGAPLPH